MTIHRAANVASFISPRSNPAPLIIQTTGLRAGPTFELPSRILELSLSRPLVNCLAAHADLVRIKSRAQKAKSAMDDEASAIESLLAPSEDDESDSLHGSDY